MNEPSVPEDLPTGEESPASRHPEGLAAEADPARESPWPARLPWLVAAALLLPYIALGVRYPDALGSPDSVHNLCIARSIAEGKGFTLDTIIQFCEREEFGELDTIRTPVTPWALGTLMKLLGPTPACARVYNTALLIALLVVVGRLATLLLRALPLRRRLDPWVEQGAWAAPLFLVFGPFHYIHAWDNNLFTLLVLTTLWLFAEPKLPNRLRLVLFGLVVALGTLNKATFALFCGAFAGLVALAWLIVRDREGWQRLRTVFASGILGIAILTPWALGNARQYGRVFPGKLLAAKWEVTYPKVRMGLGSSQIQYGRRVTFGDVVDKIGYRGVLRAHLDHAKEYFGNRSLGVPLTVFVALLLWGGVALRFGGSGVREGLRALPPPLRLYGMVTLASLATSFFVCVIFWFFEIRYAYHSIALCHLAVLAGARLIADRVSGKLARWIIAGVMAATFSLSSPLIHPIPFIRAYWFLTTDEYGLFERYRAMGAWVRRETPEDAVFMTGDMWAPYFTWDTRRRALWIPAWVRGTPEDVGVSQQLELIDRLGVTHMAFDTLPMGYFSNPMDKFRPLLTQLEADGRIEARFKGEQFVVLVLRSP